MAKILAQVLSLILCSLFFSCNSKNLKKKDDFEVFYERFFTDSIFQKERITFPLKGINTDDMELDDTIYYWKKEEWRILKRFTPKKYKELFPNGEIQIQKTDSLVKERVLTGHPSFFLDFKYAKIKGKWYLVYYADVNL